MNSEHRINSWGATFFQAGLIPPDGWEEWVRSPRPPTPGAVATLAPC